GLGARGGSRRARRARRGAPPAPAPLSRRAALAVSAACVSVRLHGPAEERGRLLDGAPALPERAVGPVETVHKSADLCTFCGRHAHNILWRDSVSGPLYSDRTVRLGTGRRPPPGGRDAEKNDRPV